MQTASCQTPASARSTSPSTAQSDTITRQLRYIHAAPPRARICVWHARKRALSVPLPVFAANRLVQEEKAEQFVSALREHVGALLANCVRRGTGSSHRPLRCSAVRVADKLRTWKSIRRASPVPPHAKSVQCAEVAQAAWKLTCLRVAHVHLPCLALRVQMHAATY